MEISGTNAFETKQVLKYPSECGHINTPAKPMGLAPMFKIKHLEKSLWDWDLINYSNKKVVFCLSQSKYQISFNIK